MFRPRNAWLHILATPGVTTLALARPAPAPPQLRRGVKTSNLEAQAFQPGVGGAFEPLPGAAGPRQMVDRPFKAG
jgi:hypothetical protein